jgi:hypothetical protein
VPLVSSLRGDVGVPSDDLGDRDSFTFCPACEPFLEVGIEPDGFDR